MARETLISSPAEAVLPLRFEQMRRRNDGVRGGFLDTAIWPWLLALNADFTWIMEYDVDFSGDWAKLFEQFRANPADLLTTTIVPRSCCPDWVWWQSAMAPPHVRPKQMYRAFLPLLRISNKLAREYASSMADPRWSGHYEFTIPTGAISAGLSVEDIGGSGPLCPNSRRNQNYRNSPHDCCLLPGTFVWRPSRHRYFIEAPEEYPETDLLYHPVKAGVPNWEKEFEIDTPTAVPPEFLALSAETNALITVSVAMATHNGERYLKEQLDSLACQELAPDELIVCDDCSTDSTVEIIREFALHAPFRVKVEENRENIGYSTSFISAAQRCTGELLLFCDQDDIWSPAKIASVSRIAAERPEQVIAHDISVFSDDAAKPSFPSYYNYLHCLGYPPSVCVKGCATGVKAQFIRTWGWPGAGTGVSHDFWIALLATAFRQRRYISQSLVKHRLHASNSSGWIAAEADRVKSAKWSAGRRRRQSDQDLLVELGIKRWNLDWTDEFLRVLGEHHPDSGKEFSSVLIGSLHANERYYSTSRSRRGR